MSVLVVGLSHHSAPLDVLERCALNVDAAADLSRRLVQGRAVREVAVLATCNRLEVYAEVETFHGGLAEIGAALVETTGVELRELSTNLFAHHGEEAVRHLFTVACGMDSMALGESQVLGQVRDMLAAAQRDHTVGRVLDPLLQRALRVGKRAFSETSLSRTGHSLVGQALGHAAVAGVDIDGSAALVVGAGAMSSLAATTLSREGVGSLVIANRNPERAERLAAAVNGQAIRLERDELVRALAEADVVISCTGARGQPLTLELIAEARQHRAVTAGGPPAPQLLIDLAMPRDVAAEVGDLPGVTLIDLAVLHSDLAGLGIGDDLAAVSQIIKAEVDETVKAARADQVAPTVAALRSYAEEVVQAELERLHGKVPQLDPKSSAEVERTVRRVVDKLLHRPTVRVKALTGLADPTATDAAHHASYAEILAELFDLQIDTAAGTSIHDLSEAMAVEVVQS